MPSPVGHLLLGMTMANLVAVRGFYSSFVWLGFIAVTAIAADLDFVVGWLFGDINRFHHGISHSVGMAIIYAGLAALIAARFTECSRRVFWVALAIYLSHLLGDYFAVDKVEPYGAKFLWPLSTQYYLSDFSVFAPIKHGDLGGGNHSVLADIFAWHNVYPVLKEMLLVIPFWLLTLWLAAKK